MEKCNPITFPSNKTKTCRSESESKVFTGDMSKDNHSPGLVIRGILAFAQILLTCVLRNGYAKTFDFLNIIEDHSL